MANAKSVRSMEQYEGMPREIRTAVKEMADEKRISDAVIKSLRDKKLEMAGEIAAKDEEIARLRALVKAREVVK